MIWMSLVSTDWLYVSDWPEWDPNGIISWLAKELDAAEKAGQRAWLSTFASPVACESVVRMARYLSDH